MFQWLHWPTVQQNHQSVPAELNESQVARVPNMKRTLHCQRRKSPALKRRMKVKNLTKFRIAFVFIAPSQTVMCLIRTTVTSVILIKRDLLIQRDLFTTASHCQHLRKMSSTYEPITVNLFISFCFLT